jgi:tetratricopeptide (TPR) repeat protein
MRTQFIALAIICSAQGTLGADLAGYGNALQPVAQTQQTDAGDVQSRLNAAKALMNAGDLQGAIRQLDEILGISQFPMAYILRAGIYMDQGDSANALADFNAALKLDPKNGMAFYGLSRLYEQQNDRGRQIDALNKAIQFLPNQPVLLSDRVHFFELDRQYKNTLDDLGQLIRLKPDEPDLLMRRCRYRVYEKMPLDGAASDCKAALAIEPNLTEALEAQALIYIFQGHLTEAIANYDAILKTQPNSTFAHFGRGIAELREHDTRAGEADISFARRMNPDVDSRFAGVLRMPDWYGLTAVDMSPSMK